MSDHTTSATRSCGQLCSFMSRQVVPRLVAIATAASIVPASADAQGVQYTVMPAVTYLRWDEGLGLERAMMFGGRAVIDFGRLVALEGDYLMSGDVIARFSEIGLTDSLGNPLANRTLDLTSYGLRIRVNLGTARLVPFLRGGASVLRFEDGDRSGSSQIAVAYGGGVRYNASPRIRAELFAEYMRFRIDRSVLAPEAAPGSDPERNDLRSNIAFGAGIGYVFGAPDVGAKRERWSLASIPIEAFTGRLDFADAALGTQSVIGVRAGIDAGNYVGLRAYYLRGVASGYDALAGVSSLGGEAQFNLNATPRIAPYLIVGGGNVAFASDFRDRAGLTPADRTVLILGGGVGLRLTDQFRFNIAARDFMHTQDARFGDVSDARDVRHDWLYTAGLSFSVGRSRRGIRIVRSAEKRVVAADTARAVAVADSAAADSAAAVPAAAVPVAADSAAARDSALVKRADRGYHSAKTVVLPVPTEGELYIRYGPPAVQDSARSRASIPRALLDTTELTRTIRRILDERRSVDSLLIRDLVAMEVGRWRMEVPRAALASAAGAPDSLRALLRAEREAAMNAQRRLQERVDSLEAAIDRASRDRAPAENADQALPDERRREGEQLEQRRYDALALIERSIPSVTAIRDTERGLSIVLGNNLFASGRGALNGRARTELRAVANLLALYPEATILVEGHSDSTGGADLNQRLSAQRAESVRRALIAHGTSSERITSRGYGDTRPVADNTTADGRARNRRAEVIIEGIQRPRQAGER